MASQQQRFTANTVRGYNPDYVAQVCTCGCNRAPHRNLTGACACGCTAFTRAEIQPDAMPPRNFCFGTLPSSRPAPQDHMIVLLPEPAPEPAHEGAMVPRPGTATRCPYCHANDFETIPSLKCPSCKAWQHSECVAEAGRCAACNAAWPA